MAVIAFHSLEDRIVKQFMRERSERMVRREPNRQPEPDPAQNLREVNRKPIHPTEAEVGRNQRARSARLRVVEKVRGAWAA